MIDLIHLCGLCLLSYFLLPLYGQSPSSPFSKGTNPIALTHLKLKQVSWNKHHNFKMNLNQINIYMVCIPSRQLGLIQNKLCGQKPFERTAEGEVVSANGTGEKVPGRREEGCSQGSLNQ